jgi:hypothetical protein
MAGLPVGDFEQTDEFDDLDRIASQLEGAGNQQSVQGGATVFADEWPSDADREVTEEEAGPSSGSAAPGFELGSSQDTLLLDYQDSSDEVVVVSQVHQEEDTQGVLELGQPVPSGSEEERTPLPADQRTKSASPTNPEYTDNPADQPRKLRFRRLNGPRLTVKWGLFEITLTLFQIEREPR